MPTKITSKGQVTIPKPFRDRLGLDAGDSVDFELAPDGRVVLLKAGAAPRPSRFEAFRGFIGPQLSTDEIMALTRGEAGE